MRTYGGLQSVTQQSNAATRLHPVRHADWVQPTDPAVIRGRVMSVSVLSLHADPVMCRGNSTVSLKGEANSMGNFKCLPESPSSLTSPEPPPPPSSRGQSLYCLVDPTGRQDSTTNSTTLQSECVRVVPRLLALEPGSHKEPFPVTLIL
ncbi:unnamed protein product [Pleuronectes platessa]|uniref:Uncharacterized protein n=1 Tax=Pleuronectes platessa TaxID=8262 RepID=A0A9N7TLV6_PLEPL|nr:unnamed protein product [Pleuronectes platessa]